MSSDCKLKTLYIGAYDFLKQRMGKEALEHKLNHYRQYRAETMQDVFWHMLNSLTNKVGMRATIGVINPLGAFLFNFDPYQTYMPGRYRFFENKIKEKIENAELNHEKWCYPVSSERSSTRQTWKKETKALSGRQQKIIQKRSIMGGGNKETVGRRNGEGSRHGVF